MEKKKNTNPKHNYCKLIIVQYAKATNGDEDDLFYEYHFNGNYFAKSVVFYSSSSLLFVCVRVFFAFCNQHNDPSNDDDDHHHHRQHRSAVINEC